MSSSPATIPLPSFPVSRPSPLPKPRLISASMPANKAFKQAGIGLASTAITAVLSSNALAFDVLMGAGAFVPREFSVNAGEQIVFINNAEAPNNVVFDEKKVPPGVVAKAISMNEGEVLIALGETYAVSLNAKGTYTFYSAPHKGEGMVGNVTVK